MEEKKKITKHTNDLVTKVFKICNEHQESIQGSHIHYKGAIGLVEDNEAHEIERKVSKALIIE